MWVGLFSPLFVCELDQTSPCEGGGELLSPCVGFQVALGLVQSWDLR